MPLTHDTRYVAEAKRVIQATSKPVQDKNDLCAQVDEMTTAPKGKFVGKERQLYETLCKKNGVAPKSAPDAAAAGAPASPPKAANAFAPENPLRLREILRFTNKWQVVSTCSLTIDR